MQPTTNNQSSFNPLSVIAPGNGSIKGPTGDPDDGSGTGQCSIIFKKTFDANKERKTIPPITISKLSSTEQDLREKNLQEIRQSNRKCKKKCQYILLQSTQKRRDKLPTSQFEARIERNPLIKRTHDEKSLNKPKRIRDKFLLLKFQNFAMYTHEIYYARDEVMEFDKNRNVIGRLYFKPNSVVFVIKAPEIRYLSTWNKNRENNLIPYPGYKDARVDEIFYNGFLKVSENIRKYFTTTIKKHLHGRNLLILGHRLAGGNIEFANLVEKMVTVSRVTLMDDQIPRFPISTGKPNFDSYVHHGIEYWIEGKCDCNTFEFYICPSNVNGLKENPLVHDPDFTYDGPYFGYRFGYRFGH
ncbi:hypothetical protein G9A89_016811 [Geosiphon pyriformis]|nr:hypothetical protein G9A89_016811 [Geosiphon pyriformis]